MAAAPPSRNRHSVIVIDTVVVAVHVHLNATLVVIRSVNAPT
jgi:hypothetical protein